MNLNRRFLITAATITAVFSPLRSFAQNKILKVPFFAEIEVPKNFNPDFRKSESSSVDVNKVNEDYLREGKILSIDAKEGPESITYRYKFANYDIYREWNDKVYHQNTALKQSLAANGTKFNRFF